MSSTAKAIAALQATLPVEQLLLPGSDAYATSNGAYLAQQESELQPAAIFQPKSAEDVAKFVKIVKPFAVGGSATFAIRGAGNMPLPGCANDDGGLTLDLGFLTTVELHENRTVSVGAGAQWSAVDKVVEAAGLGVTGGRSGNGGIGGLSFFSSREGFISDNVLSFEIVLASGAITTASPISNPDLWRALRGGGNNFGIVTRYDLATFPLPAGPSKPLWGGNVYYFTPGFPAQIEALVAELKKGKDADPNTHLLISTGYSAQFGVNMCLNTVYYTQPTDEAPPALQPFTNIEPQVQTLNSLKPLNLTEAAAGQAAGVASHVRVSYMNVAVKADVATLQAAADIYNAAVTRIKNATGLTCSLTFQPYPVSLLETSAAKGGNSLGLDAAHGPVVSVLLLTYWNSKKDDARITEAMKGALESIQAQAVEKTTALKYVYLNYAADFQDPIGSYGGLNKAFLQGVSKTHDFEGLFQKGVPGGFKLFT
ncbi:hypothetical protein G7Y89_g4884 [Cudoniella acicularis]|uniref:FAD-binding PCMH-type domain-containing protein n=1 Tax=Cudoniella acicularis TaxID=354080 RepID=A0A8H4RQR1_9HELO|nr:hypothetical protein G7Y89_g4884 [Cudoniella acicularis]